MNMDIEYQGSWVTESFVPSSLDLSFLSDRKPREPSCPIIKYATISRKFRLTTRRKVHEGPVQCGLSSSRGWGPQRPNPWTKTLAIGTRNVTSLGGKEPELVREVERYQLEIVGLTSTHSLGSGTQLLERGWTLHYSGVAQAVSGGELVWACL
ncbi:hypothetical protein L3Q82_006210 [Scortum barcoo]|uniref:Uncharacterized protein n=1 Tax=Scortum barcoo TaxID=214431 RepID=A0ACB8X228_9TELE|nr:hypothetical protein L3Q82_006210 [Scortum barcoo]